MAGFLFIAGVNALAAPGDLDTTFGGTGKIVTPVGSDDRGNAVAVQTDGKIIAAGWATVSGSGVAIALVRYNPDGSLDASFGSNGKVTTSIGGGSTGDFGSAVALQPDGKIIVAGETGNHPNIKFVLVRYTLSGTLDTSFGTGGKVVTAVSTVGNSGANALALQPDGKIIAAGYAQDASFTGDFAAARFNPDGTLDASFGTGGKVITPVGAGNDEALAAALQPDGKLVLTGTSSNNSFASVRYNPQGIVDQTFGAAGKAVTTFPNQGFVRGKDVALQADGKILVTGVVAGLNGSKFTLVRYNPDGSLDAGFGTGGIVMTAIGSMSASNTLAVQADGKISVGGNSAGDLALARYTSTGTLDASFGTNGIVITPVNNGEIRDVAVQPDGKIVAVGTNQGTALDNSSLIGGAEFIIAARYLGDAAAPRRAPFDFDGDGKTDYGVFRPASGIWYLLSSQSGFSALRFGISSDKPVPADFDGDGKADIAVYRAGTWFLQRSAQGFLGIAFGDAGDVPVPADFNGDGKAELAVFRPLSGTWYLYDLAANGVSAAQFGASGDKPVPADFDADGKADMAVFRPASGTWYVQRSQLGFTAVAFGIAADKPVAADFDGDGKADVAVARQSGGVTTWYILGSMQGFYAAQFGSETDRLVPGDYDGDGKADIAVWRDSNGAFYVLRSNGNLFALHFGQSGDVPVAASVIP